ncbi:MAG: archaetidylserine decarboxylase [Cellvibrionaceae bacterium]
MKQLFIFLQHLLPHHLLSRGVGFFAESEIDFLKNSLISLFIKAFNVDMSQAIEENPHAYRTFNDFFIRNIKPELRPLCPDTNSVACPADGTISQLGDIESGKLFQAKGKDFDLTALLGGDQYLSQHFLGGKFATIYLSPKDYHRVHMPFDGQLQTMVHVPGKLFSVNSSTVELVPDLFARNERVVTIFDTNSGPMAVILVGAMIVASIETVWEGQITPHKKQVHTTEYPNTTSDVILNKGEEMGLFKLGSTAIVLFGPDCVEWKEDLEAGSTVKMGEELGRLANA